MKDLFVEFIWRLSKDNPRFFKVIQSIALILALVSQIVSYSKSLNLELPLWIMILGDTSVFVASILAAVIAQLPNKD